MTSQEYAQMVTKVIQSAYHALALDADEDTVPLIYAFEDLAAIASARCLGVGRDQYEIQHNLQRFEGRDVADAIAQCREEVVDIPAYLAQVAWHLGRLDDVDVRSAIGLCADLFVTLHRIEARVASG